MYFWTRLDLPFFPPPPFPQMLLPLVCYMPVLQIGWMPLCNPVCSPIFRKYLERATGIMWLCFCVHLRLLSRRPIGKSIRGFSHGCFFRFICFISLDLLPSFRNDWWGNSLKQFVSLFYTRFTKSQIWTSTDFSSLSPTLFSFLFHINCLFLDRFFVTWDSRLLGMFLSTVSIPSTIFAFRRSPKYPSFFDAILSVSTQCLGLNSHYNRWVYGLG